MAVPALPPFAVAPITYKDGGTIGASRLETHPTADGFANPLVDHVRALWDQAEALRTAVNGVSTNVGLLGSQAPVGALITGGRDDGTWGALTGAPGVLRYDETQPRGVRWSRTLPSPGWVTVPLGTNWYHYGSGLRARLLYDDVAQLSGWIHDSGELGPAGYGASPVAVLPVDMRPAGNVGGTLFYDTISGSGIQYQPTWRPSARSLDAMEVEAATGQVSGPTQGNGYRTYLHFNALINL